ncbi:DUF4856 domain-containing protein [Colwellia sp. UCD-KL20]|uniref:DUF4856 domain-containing protein n=1 Tax=Colwellia sp. UCD-KL20 TaxID=1917165 RepID=UPI000970EFEE|nr:DUF4856 domain-containing protein [Colwellia sp. UCD-KL20]
MNIKKSALSLAVLSSFLLTACGGSNNDSSAPTVEDNVAPTNITLSNASVAENSIAAALGNLSAVDANNGDTFTFSVSDERFAVSGNQLSLAEGVMLDFETETSIEIEVTVTDSKSATFTKTLTIEVTDVLDTYTFDSKFIDGDSAVSYTGQIARHVLIAELNHYIGNQLEEDLKPSNGTLSTRQQVLDKLNSFFRTTEEQYDNFPITFMANTKQKFITDISSSPKNLIDKIAGNDETGQHKDWNDDDFAGWGDKGSTTPEGLIDIYFGQLADNAEQLLSGNTRGMSKVYINTDGTDLKQLIQKFLLMAVAYSQGTDDYLDADIDNKGLKSDFIQDGTKAYSKLEHQFDEGYGYFGASREYLAYNDNELSGKAGEDDRADWNNHHDTDGDGEFDLTSEVNFGNSVNAAKRDSGTLGNTMPTDYTKQVMEALITGRKVINDNAGVELSEDQFNALIEQRDLVVDGWERAIAATVIHYINDTHADLAKLGTDDFNFADAAKHFSELKGFALGLQFNPHSPITDTQFEEFHTLIGDAPELDSAEVAAYQAKLIQARNILAAALSFNAENVESW